MKKAVIAATLFLLAALPAQAQQQPLTLTADDINGIPFCPGMPIPTTGVLVIDPTIQVPTPPGGVPWPPGCLKFAPPPAAWAGTIPKTPGNVVVVDTTGLLIQDSGAPLSGGGSGAGQLHKVPLLTSQVWATPSGTTTATVYVMDLVGPGGGAGAGWTAGHFGTGAGGGAVCRITISGLSPATSITFTAGTPGAGATGGNDGISGTASTLLVGSTTYTAGAGAGSPGNVFGAPSNGANNVGGVGGTFSSNCDSDSAPGGDGVPGVWNQSVGLGVIAGRGGDTPGFGTGGAAASQSAGNSGGNGKGFGAGGGGGIAPGSNGGNGAPALLVIKWVQ